MKTKVKSGIYQIVNIINDKRYIGSSSNIGRRFQQHRNNLLKNKYENKNLQQDFDECGIGCFEFEIIELCAVELLEARESFYFDKYVWDDLYNDTKNTHANTRGITGKKRKPFTEEHKQKLRKAISGENHPMYGKHHTVETKKNISVTMTVIPKSEQAKHNMSIAKTCIPKSDQAKHNMSIAQSCTIYINKDNINKRLKPEFLEQYIIYGWVLGRISKKRGKYKKDLCNNNEILEETIIL